MKIDIKRLGTDLDYWNSVAPEGATHFDLEDLPAYYDGDDVVLWLKNESEEWYAWCRNHWNGPLKNSDLFIEGQKWTDCIPRPKKGVHEWDGAGLPPIGIMCEFRYRGQEWEGRSCKVLGFDPENDMCWLHLDGNEISNLYALDVFEFRPLRTKEQIEREEVINEALYYLGFSATNDVKAAIEKLYNLGMLRRNNK